VTSRWWCELPDGRRWLVRAHRNARSGDWSYAVQLADGCVATGGAMGEADAVVLGCAAVARATDRVPARITREGGDHG
jgi:hypothetical protein